MCRAIRVVNPILDLRDKRSQYLKHVMTLRTRPSIIEDKAPPPLPRVQYHRRRHQELQLLLLHSGEENLKLIETYNQLQARSQSQKSAPVRYVPPPLKKPEKPPEKPKAKLFGPLKPLPPLILAQEPPAPDRHPHASETVFQTRQTEAGQPDEVAEATPQRNTGLGPAGFQGRLDEVADSMNEEDIQ
jgi:hypothetical protein